MSFDGIGDRDLSLKLRLMNFLWRLGYVSRPNIPLHAYREGRRSESMFTDIDVMALKYNPFHEPIIAVCSAKSGKDGDSSQLYFLAGVREHFGANQAFYIRSKGEIDRVRQLSKALKIVVLNEEQLTNLENGLGIESQITQPIIDSGTFNKFNLALKELKFKDKELFDYITERYWIDKPYRQLMRSIECASNISKLGLRYDISIELRFYVSSLFVLALARFLVPLISIPIASLRSEIEAELFGGELAQRETAKVIEKVKEVIDHASKSSNNTPRNITDYSKMFKIRYIDELYDLCVRLIDNFHSIHELPRLFDYILFMYVVNLESVNLADVFNMLRIRTPTDQRISIRLLKDTITFLERIGIFSREEAEVYTTLAV